MKSTFSQNFELKLDTEEKIQVDAVKSEIREISQKFESLFDKNEEKENNFETESHKKSSIHRTIQSKKYFLKMSKSVNQKGRNEERK